MTIRNLDDETKRLLRQRAASHYRSMEEEARRILRSAVRRERKPAVPLGDLPFRISRPGVELPDVRDRTPHKPIEL